MTLPKGGYTKNFIHIKLEKSWVLRAFKELTGQQVPKDFEDAFMEQFKDRLFSEIIDAELIKSIFSDMIDESIIFKYKGD